MHAFAVPLVRVEREGVELGVVCRVVAVDVGVFENVALRVKCAKMPDRVAYDVEVRTAKYTCQTRPSPGTVQWFDGMSYFHCRAERWRWGLGRGR